MRSFYNSRPIGWLLFISFSVFLFYRILLIQSVQTDLGGIENAVIYFIQRAIAGISIYTNPELPPYSINQYGPLYFNLVAFIAKIFRVNPGDVLSVFSVNRSVSLFLNLCYVWIIYLTLKNIYNLGKAKSLGAATIAFIFIEITSFARPDSLNHLMFFGSLYYFLLSIHGQRNTSIYLVISAIIAVVAFFSKQSSFTLPVIICLWLILKKQHKSLVIYSFAYAISFCVSLIIIHKVYGLNAFLLNIVMGVNNGINLGLFWGNIIKPFFASFGLLFIPAAIFLWRFLKRQQEACLHFTAFAMILQLIISTLLALKFGSHINYFTEFWTLLLFGIVFSWDSFSKACEAIFPEFPRVFLAFIIVLKLALISFPLFEELPYRTHWRREFFEKEKKIAQAIKKDIGDSSGRYVFNNLFSPHSFLNNFFFKEAIMPQYEIVYFTTYHRKVFDYTQFKNLFKTGRVKYIISNFSDSTPRFMDFAIENFSLKQEVEGYKIFVLNDSLVPK